VRDLLARGALRTGADFRKAAFVFQHGDSADDYLLAHVLATLDRYLQAIGRKQIFGTQYTGRGGANPAMTQEPYDRGLLSDAPRAQLRVISQAEQERTRAELSRPEKGATH
jgi:hypothetical protein